MTKTPPGFQEVQTPDGLKITEDGKVFFLIAPSDAYLKAAALDSLFFRSTRVDTAAFPNGSWERTNDYQARVRVIQEKDGVGANVGGQRRVEIGEDEVVAQLAQDEFATFKADVEALPGGEALKAPLLSYIQYVGQREAPDTLAPVSLRVSQEMGCVGDVVGVEVRMDTPPSGLSGYDFTATIIDDRIAKFTDVAFRAPFPLNQHLPDPVDGPLLTSMSGIDTGNVVGGGFKDVLLCTLSVELLAVGASRIQLGLISLDDDRGFPINVNIAQGAITAA